MKCSVHFGDNLRRTSIRLMAAVVVAVSMRYRVFSCALLAATDSVSASSIAAVVNVDQH